MVFNQNFIAGIARVLLKDAENNVKLRFGRFIFAEKNKNRSVAEPSSVFFFLLFTML